MKKISAAFTCLFACLFLSSTSGAYEYSVAGVDDAVMGEMLGSAVNIIVLKGNKNRR